MRIKTKRNHGYWEQTDRNQGSRCLGLRVDCHVWIRQLHFQGFYCMSGSGNHIVEAFVAISGSRNYISQDLVTMSGSGTASPGILLPSLDQGTRFLGITLPYLHRARGQKFQK